MSGRAPARAASAARRGCSGHRTGGLFRVWAVWVLRARVTGVLCNAHQHTHLQASSQVRREAVATHTERALTPHSHGRCHYRAWASDNQLPVLPPTTATRQIAATSHLPGVELHQACIARAPSAGAGASAECRRHASARARSPRGAARLACSKPRRRGACVSASEGRLGCRRPQWDVAIAGFLAALSLWRPSPCPASGTGRWSGVMQRAGGCTVLPNHRQVSASLRRR
jgi:hypothetical protein